MTTICKGYDKDNRRVRFDLDDSGTLQIVDEVTGESEPFNDEFYTEDSDIRFMLIHDGFRID